MVGTTTNWQKIGVTLGFIILSYWIASILLKGNAFSTFDLAWRIAITLGVLLSSKGKFHISPKQWLILCFFGLAEMLFYSIISPATSWLTIIIAIIGAPFAEELFFRGWLMDHISGNHKKKIIISSIFFALYHLKNVHLLTAPALITQVVYAGLIVGPAFAWIRLKYDSLFLVLLLHSGNNAFANTVTPNLVPLIVEKKTGLS